MTTFNKKFINNVIEMIRLYDLAQNFHTSMSPSEFAKSNFCEKKLFIHEMKEGCFAVFFEVCSFREFLDTLCDDKLWPRTPAGIAYMYLLMFYMTPINRDVILESFLKEFPPVVREGMLKFFSQEELFSIIEKNTSAVYGEYDKRNLILKEIKERIPMINHTRVLLERIKCQRKLQTVNFTFDNGYFVLSDLNTLVKGVGMPIRDVSVQSTHKKLSKLNCTMPSKATIPPQSASSTLESIAESVSASSKSDGKQETLEKLSRSIDRTTEGPPVKQTVAQLLREDARVKKKAEQAEKVFKEICKGSADPYKIQVLLDAIKQEENNAKLCEIERKHLLGRISREESRLAKLSLQKSNQERAVLLKKQRQNLEDRLAEYRRQEEARIKELAEKSHITLELIRQAQTNLLNQKKKTAKEIQEESRQMQAFINQRKKEELNHKINLIRQIKELEHASKVSLNKYSGSKEIGSIGLSCAMTLKELKEALTNLRDSIQEQIATRRDKIQKEKLRQQTVIKNARETIERYKNISKNPLKPNSTKEVKLTPEIIQLRQKLREKQQEAARLERNF